jgi:hypothetical protein
MLSLAGLCGIVSVFDGACPDGCWGLLSVLIELATPPTCRTVPLNKIDPKTGEFLLLFESLISIAGEIMYLFC